MRGKWDTKSMRYPRLHNLLSNLDSSGVCIDLREYRKAKLVMPMIFRTYGDITPKIFEMFMEKADLLEASIYETIRLQSFRDDYTRPSEAWFRAETFRQMEKELAKLSAFTGTYK